MVWLLNPKGIVSFSPRLRGTSYLGNATAMNATPTGLWPDDVHQRRNPVGVVIFSQRLTQGGSFLATLGFEAESLWDSWTARLSLPETEMHPLPRLLREKAFCGDGLPADVYTKTPVIGVYLVNSGDGVMLAHRWSAGVPPAAARIAG